MAKKNLSIRVNLETVAQCYDVVSIGRSTENMAMGTVITTALEGILLAIHRLGQIPSYKNEGEALERIKKSLPQEKWQGQELQEIVLKSTLFKKEMDSVDTSTISATIEEKPVIEPFQDQEQRQALQDALDLVIEEHLAESDKDFEEAVSTGTIYRDHEESQKELPKQAPWEGKLMVSIEILRAKVPDLLTAAEEVGDLMIKALQISYAVIPASLWGTEKAIDLVRGTYIIFKSHEELSASIT